MNGAQKKLLIVFGASSLVFAGCGKKKVVVATPPPPAPAVSHGTTARPATTPPRAAVTQPPAAATQKPAYPSAATRARIDELLARIEDAYFDYNKVALRPDALKALESDSTDLRDILKDYPTFKLTIEGHCDERGSAEYNMALGDRRAETAKDYLVQVGIPSGQLNVVSYGKDRPVCEDHNEVCWQRNRRIHILAMAQAH